MKGTQIAMPEPGQDTIEVQIRGETIKVPAYRDTEGNQYLTLSNSQKYLNMTRYTFEQYLESLKIPTFKFRGKALYVLRSDLDRIRAEDQKPKPVQRG